MWADDVGHSVGPPGMDIVTCYGRWQTSLHPFDLRDADGDYYGTNKTQDCMEVYCTEMVA